MRRRRRGAQATESWSSTLITATNSCAGSTFRSLKKEFAGLQGISKTHSVYYSTSNRRVGAFDLETEKVVWEKTYEVGADRSSITMDGKKLYVPSGWWDKAEDGGLLVVNATNGELIKRIRVGPQAHNSFVSLNGRFVYLARKPCSPSSTRPTKS